MRHPVTFVLEVAEAAITTGEVTVELFAGVETVTLTDADANIDKEITHRTMDSVHRITTFLLKGCCAQRRGLSRGHLRIMRGFAFCVLVSKIFVWRKESNWVDSPITRTFFT